MAEGTDISGGRALSFEDFVEAALGAAVRAAAKQASPDLKPGQLPFPIWVGIVAGPFDKGQFGGGGVQQ